MDTRIAAEEDPRRFGKPLAMIAVAFGATAFGTIALFATFGKAAVSFLS